MLIIKNMEMPNSCHECRFWHMTYMLSRNVCVAKNMAEIHPDPTTKIDPDCPLCGCDQTGE